MTPSTSLIHPTAVIHSGAELHPTVQVGPYAVVGSKVKVGAETVIGSHVVIDGWTEIGERNQIFTGAAIGLEPQDLKYDGSLSLVKIGNDNRIREYVTINRATRAGEATVVGNNNLLMAYSHIAHNCVIENHVIITNAVSLAGHVHLESQARIGGMVGIHQFVHVGRLAMVGGMTKVDRDIPPYMLVDGNPSRVRSLNVIGLKRAGFSDDSEGKPLQTLKKAFRALYRSELSFNESLAQLDLLPGNEALYHLRQFLRCSQMEGRRGLTPGKRAKGDE